MRHSMNAQRGQAIVEAAIFMPLLLLAMFAIIYFNQLGVANERSFLAARYGGLTAFYAAPGSLYSGNNIYAFYAGAAGSPGPATCPTAPPGAYSNSAPFPGPVSASYWVPVVNTAPSPGPCVIMVKNLGGANFLASRYFAASAVTTSASVAVNPPLLQQLFGPQATVRASEAFAHPAYPSVILACTGSQVYSRAYGALFPNSTPPPAPTCLK